MESQFLHWEIFCIVRQESQFIHQRHRGNRRVRNGERFPLASIVSLYDTGKAGDRPGEVIVFEASEEFFRGWFFLRTQPGINLRDVDRAASQKMALLDQT